MHRNAAVLLALVVTIMLVLPAGATDRVPGDHWLRYADPADAGFDPELLEAARASWQELPSSAFMIVADGAVVAAWGDVERRFMCHSVRKSFLSALYGIYWDRGEIKLNKTLADLGIDDTPEPLLDSERQARILDLLKARSGVFHPAAYAGRTDSRPRGSEGPGRYFAYNNWDFNTLATILMQETGDDVFESFDEHFAQPLGMEDWRVSDGYYHYERDKSSYPAYPFRMSARDAARFGLLFTREGLWGDSRILSRHWVRRSTALYSIDDDVFGYGFMWWVARELRFTRHGLVCALGVGNQMIAALPDSDIVIVNRADTYAGERTPMKALTDLIEQVLAARTGGRSADPELVPLEAGAADPSVTTVAADRLTSYAGTWSYPPAPLGLPAFTDVEVSIEEGHLVMFSPYAGSFELYLQPDGSLIQEDSLRRYLPVHDESGLFTGMTDTGTAVRAAVLAAGSGDSQRAETIMAIVADEELPMVPAARAVVELLGGRAAAAEQSLRKLAEDNEQVEGAVNQIGYILLGADRAEAAHQVFELNTRLYPDAFNTWDSLAEVQMNLGNDEAALRFYRKSLDLNEGNRNAERMIARIRNRGAEPAGIDYQALMEAARIPGLTVAVIESREIVRTELLGVADAESGEPVTEATLFEAASLSKPVCAAIALRLAERGELDLDRPLHEYLPYERVGHDSRSGALTARMVLSHRTGLPNWGDDKLELGFYPGVRFGYSGEGFVYLQKVLEKLTGLSLDELARQEVFVPLGMTHSRYSWAEGDQLPLAMPHDQIGRRQQKLQAHEANAAASLHTTAGDYARFVTAWMRGEVLSPAMVRQALAPVVGTRANRDHSWRPWEVRNRIAWGLGWGVQLPAEGQESEPISWHWGDNGDFKAFVAFRPQAGDGVVYFANGANGLAIGRPIVAEHLDDMRPAFSWTGNEAHDAPGFTERIQAAEAEEEGRYTEAIAAYDAALQADPDHDETRARRSWLLDLIRVAEQPVELAEALLQSYAGSYGPRTISFHDGQLFYQRQGRDEYRLIPLSESLFALDGLSGFRIEVVTDRAGQATHLVGHYLSGRRDESPRDAPEES
jgi:CubicO group peptidase (beta-lactamase class C family)